MDAARMRAMEGVSFVELHRRKWLSRPRPEAIKCELGRLSGIYFHMQVVVILFRVCALPVLIQRGGLGSLIVRPAGKDWVWCRSTAAGQQVFRAVNVV